MMSDLERLRLLRAQRAARLHGPDLSAYALNALYAERGAGKASVRTGITFPDPRPDLDQDSAHWTRLLALAAGDRDDPHGIFGRLLAMRACGGQLVWDGSRWRLEPLIDAGERQSVWHDRASWEADRARYLLPRAQEIADLLTALAKETNP
jgi:hypothetical protein